MNGLFTFVVMAKTERTEKWLVCASAFFCMAKVEHGPCRFASLQTSRLWAASEQTAKDMGWRFLRIYVQNMRSCPLLTD
jgi:hypothetical protein